LINNENFAVKNVVIFLDIVMKLSLVQIYLYIVDRFRKKGRRRIRTNISQNIPKEEMWLPRGSKNRGRNFEALLEGKGCNGSAGYIIS